MPTKAGNDFHILYNIGDKNSKVSLNCGGQPIDCVCYAYNSRTIDRGLSKSKHTKRLRYIDI